MNNFADSALSLPLRNNLSKHGFQQPTPIQASTIEPGLAGHDLVATAQTGTGKTLAFLLPLLHRLGSPKAGGIQAIVLSPTRELAIQISETFQLMAPGTGLRSVVVVGGMGEGPQLTAIRKGAQVVIATPGRLHDYLIRKLVDLSKVRMVVLDEADRMLDMGFLPTINAILAATPSTRQTLFFSATMEKSVQHLVKTHVRNPVRVEMGSTTKPASAVNLHLYEVEHDRKLGLLEWMLREEPGSFLIFARTKHGADRLSQKLARTGVKSAAIHGNRSQNQRNQALRGFQEGYYRVLVATDVAARGIHVEGISQVVNYDLPQVPEDFIHRVGRTGRAGATGTASTFATRSERSEIARIEKAIGMGLVRRQVAPEVRRETRDAMKEVTVAKRATLPKRHTRAVPRAKRRSRSRP